MEHHQLIDLLDQWKTDAIEGIDVERYNFYSSFSTDDFTFEANSQFVQQIITEFLEEGFMQQLRDLHEEEPLTPNTILIACQFAWEIALEINYQIQTVNDIATSGRREEPLVPRFIFQFQL
jgi:hypothetical protein